MAKTTWVDHQTPINAENMNNIEDRIEEALTRTMTPGKDGTNGIDGADGVRGAVWLFANGDVLSNATVPKTDLTIPEGVTPAKNDIVADVKGDTYFVTSVTTDSVTVGANTPVKIKGADGINGKAGTNGTNGTDGANGKSIASVEFAFTTTDGKITAASGKYKLDGEATATHAITCTITPSA